MCSSAIYCYENSALSTFRVAQRIGLRRYYELPIRYWETAQRLLRQEAERYPKWEPTLQATRDSTAKLQRKGMNCDWLILSFVRVVRCRIHFPAEQLLFGAAFKSRDSLHTSSCVPRPPETIGLSLRAPHESPQLCNRPATSRINGYRHRSV